MVAKAADGVELVTDGNLSNPLSGGFRDIKCLSSVIISVTSKVLESGKTPKRKIFKVKNYLT